MSGLENHITTVTRALLGEPNAKLSTNSELRFGSHGSLVVRIAGERKGAWYDHEQGRGGGVLDLIRDFAGLEGRAAFDWLREQGIPVDKPNGGSRRIVATYDYRDASGALAFQVVRFEPKEFRQRRPDGRGGWIWDLKDIEPVPYRLPELLAPDMAAMIYIVEGEKDVDALRSRGLVATCNAGGAGKWHADFGPLFHHRNVTIIPDNDEAGRKHAQDVASKLQGAAASIRVAKLPELPPKGDVSDWLAAGGTVDALAAVPSINATEYAAKPSAAGAESCDWSAADVELLRSHTHAAPVFPANVLPKGWHLWCTQTAEAAGCPLDFVACALLAVAGAMIGNARWASPWSGWQEPPSLNVALVGLPSSGKSPALDALTDILANIEREQNVDWDDRRLAHQRDALAAKERLGRYEADLKEAIKEGAPPPDMPRDTISPEPIQRRRVFSTDPTIEKAARLAHGNPRGMLLLRDELAGWIAGMDRYSSTSGGDRAFWLQAHGGRAWTPDRVKDGDADISVRHLTWSVLGGIQPDRVAKLLLAGDDDGLTARFLYTWPDGRRPSRPRVSPDRIWAQKRLAALRALPWPAEPDAAVLPFSEPAAALIQEWRERAASLQAEASGMFLSWIGKLPRFAVRLALVLEYLESTETGGRESVEIGEIAVLRALGLLEDYSLPMARRVFGEAALPQAESDARRLARWLVARRPIPTVLNAKALRRMASGPGIPNSERMEAALIELEAAGWVRATPARESGHGRPRKDYALNPRVTETLQ